MFRIFFLITIFVTVLLKANEIKDFYDKDKSILLKVEKKYAKDFICDISLDWRGETRTRKMDNQVKVIFFEDGTLDNVEIFLAAVRDINDALGYAKLEATIKSNLDKTYSSDGEIFVYYGTYSKGNSLLRNAGSPSAMSGWWGSWSHWDDRKNITKTTIAIDKKKVSGILLAYCLRRSILIPLGYPGGSSNYPANNLGAYGIFSSSNTNQILKNPTTQLKYQSELITEYDKATIRFSERYVNINSSRLDIEKAVSTNWDNFILDFYNNN